MLELFVALLLNLATLQGGVNNPATIEKSESGKNTTITTNKGGETTTKTSIGSGGWDPNGRQ